MITRQIYVLWSILCMNLLIFACKEDKEKPLLSCKIKTASRVATFNDSPLNSHSQTYTYNEAEILQTLALKDYKTTYIEYNSQGLVTRMGFENGKEYIWKYISNTLAEVEIRQGGVKQVEYYFVFDSEKRLTAITSDDPNEYVYRWKYAGNSRNPSQKTRYLIFDFDVAGIPAGLEVLMDSTVYQYDNKPHPETTLKGFPLTPEYFGIFIEPIPDNNITQEDYYTNDYDESTDSFTLNLGSKLGTAYTYNVKGYPLTGKTVNNDGSASTYQANLSFTYQDCE